MTPGAGTSARSSRVALPVALLALAVLMASTGTTWFALQLGTPIMKAAWRLQLCFLVQLPLMLLELRALSQAQRAAWLRVLWRLAPATGALLGVHFAGVAFAVQSTALTHAILTCNTSPAFLIVIALSRFALSRALGPRSGGAGKAAPLADDGASAAWWSSDEPGVAGREALPLALPPECLVVDERSVGGAEPVAPPPATMPAAAAAAAAAADWLSAEASPAPTRLEVVGTLLCLAGICILVAEAEARGAGGGGDGDGGVSALGDASGLLASLCLGLVFLASAEVRKRHGVPLWCWLCPLNFAAAALSTAAGAAIEGSRDAYLGPLAWTSSGRVFGIAMGSALTVSQSSTNPPRRL